MEIMKKSEAFGMKVLLRIFVGIVIVLLYALPVQAEELQTKTGSMEGVLQAGNLLEPTEGIMAYSLYSDTSQAEQAIINAISLIEDSVDISEYEIQSSDMADIVRRILNNNPQFFYMQSYMWTYNTNSGNVISIKFTYYDSASELKAVYEANVSSLLAQVNDSWTDMEKIVFINDYIATHCVYDEGALVDSPAPHTYDAYGVLVNGLAVCQGYAEAFQDLMNRLDVPCELVTSRSLNHAWNMVLIGKDWYHVDVTWNDPISDLIGRARHYYLLKSADWFQDTNKGKHNASDYVFSGSGTVSSAASTTYDDYFWNDIDTSFVYADGNWYGLIKSTGKLNQYSVNASGFTLKKEICTISDKWPAEGNSFYVGCFSHLGFLKDKIYYSTPREIYAYHLSTGVQSSVYSLTDEEVSAGNIYGMVIQDGILTYGLASTPNGKITEKTYVLHRHNYSSAITKTATCTENGTETRRCEGCGEEAITVIPATGHKPGKAATCTEAQTCTTCGKVIEKATGHKPGKAATCTEAQTCTTCGKVIEKATGHKPGKAATCTEAQTCTTCGKVIKKATGHIYQNKVTPATLTKDGKTVSVCKVCGDSKKTGSISRPKSVTLSNVSYTYNGKAKKPSVTVKDANGKTISKSNYTVSYESGRKNVGKYKVKVTFKGNYKGTKNLYFTINPAPVKIKSLTAGSKKLTVKWARNTKQVTGYEIAYSTSKDFTETSTKTITIKKNTPASQVISKLKAKKKYYVRIRTYKSVSGKKYYSEWSKVKNTTTKK
ncbi:MAG: fibronectin type III domain-containing protein [Roseburia sp.]|nr:fibronectin type III domain-containing protein [Roseburia sp.]